MSQTTSAFSAVLKDVYLDKIREQINMSTNLLDMFVEGDVSQYEWMGKRLVFALHSGRNASGVKYTSEGGGLPVAGSQSTANLFIPMSFGHGRIQLTAQVMKASRSSKGAFTTAMALEQKGLVNDIARQRNRALTGYGQGTLARCALGVNSATQTTKDPGGVVGTTNPNRFFQVGMIVAITDSTGATLRGTGTILSTTSTSIVLDTILNTTTGDLISIATTSLGTGESSYNLEPEGLLSIVDKSTYKATIFSLDRSAAANAFFATTIMSSVGALSADVLQRGTDNAWEVSGEMIDAYVAHVSVRREVIKLVEADRRYASSDKPQNYDAGTSAGAFKKDISFNGVPVRVDKDAPYGILFGLNKSHLFWFPETKGEWVDDDGNVLFRLANSDGFEARYRYFENFGSDRGNSLVRFDGVTATVTSQVFSG